MDGNPGAQMYGQMNRHYANSGGGYSMEHDPSNQYMESNSGERESKHNNCYSDVFLRYNNFATIYLNDFIIYY